MSPLCAIKRRNLSTGNNTTTTNNPSTSENVKHNTSPEHFALDWATSDKLGQALSRDFSGGRKVVIVLGRVVFHYRNSATRYEYVLIICTRPSLHPTCQKQDDYVAPTKEQ